MKRCLCGIPTRNDAYVCDECIDKLDRDLGDIPALAKELETTLTRQSRIGERTGARSAEKPLPYDQLASITLDTMRSTLGTWRAIISLAQCGIVITGFDDSPPAMTGFIQSNLDWVRSDPDGPQLLDEIRYLTQEMRRRIDLPPTYFYCGPCNGRTVSMQLTADNGMLTYEAETEKCTGSLYALLTSKTVSCRNCGTIYDVATRRQWLLAELEDALLPLRLVWEALPRLVGVQPDWETVRRWPKLTGPRHLDVRGLTTTDVELFRAGDVLALVRRDNRRLPTRLPT